jgi:hypothetical protein
LIGGFLMALLGILYLVLEDLVLADFSRHNIRAVHKRNHSFGRALMGAQVSHPPWIQKPSLGTPANTLPGRLDSIIYGCDTIQCPFTPI